MNAATLLLAPWRASPRWTHWYVGATTAAAVVAAALIGVFMHGAWFSSAAAVLALAAAFLGMFLLAPGLLLVTDGQQLRVPGLVRDTILGLVLLAVLAVAVPAAALGVVGGPMADIACMLALGLCLGLLTGVLPRLLSALIGFLPMTFNSLQPQLQLPGPGQAGFLPLGGGAVALMLVLCVLCWWRQLRADDPYRQGWSRPMVLQFRRGARASAWGGFASGLPDSIQHIRQQPDWLQPRIDLRPSGPAHPRYSLRIALGGLFAPMTLAGRARQLALAVLPSMLVLVLLAARIARRHGGWNWNLLPAGVGLFAWCAGYIGLIVTLVAVLQQGQRWQKDNAELPLLALLPGLGTPARLRRDLLGASLLPGAGVQLTLMALLGGVAVAAHLGGVAVLGLLLTPLAALGFLIAATLAVLGGRPLPGWANAILCSACFVLPGLGLVWVMAGKRWALDHGVLLAVFLGAWVGLLLALAWLGRRGWQGLCQRPHPFMANPA